MKREWLSIFSSLLLLVVHTGCFAQDSYRSLIHYDVEALKVMKGNLLAHTATDCASRAFSRWVNIADSLLSVKNPTVMDKEIDPPSGDKHDYLSISRYWWPDLEKAGGLPWIRKDGITNPATQTDAVDRNRLGRMTSSVKYLSLAYFFTEEEKYAEKAASMLHSWFLAEDTQMNPHLRYAQSVPGNPKGRRSGILDGRLIALVVPDAIALLRGSPHWTGIHEEGMKGWLTRYAAWLSESDLGKSATIQQNNHGSWYRLHVGTIALFLGQDSLAKRMVLAAQQSLASQLDSDGGQVHELKRSRSFFYSCFNLEALVGLARIGDRVETDLWSYETAKGKSMKLALQYLLPVVDGAEWQHQTLGREQHLGHLIPVLNRFAKHFHQSVYPSYVQKVLAALGDDHLGKARPTLLQQCLIEGLSTN